jgi:hypothetical protein
MNDITDWREKERVREVRWDWRERERERERESWERYERKNDS